MVDNSVFWNPSKIIYTRAYAYEHQYNLILGLAAKMAEEPFRLLVIISLSSLLVTLTFSTYVVSSVLYGKQDDKYNVG